MAFEPVASNVHFIIQNMKANGWGSNITVLPVAAGAEPGFADIFGIGTGASLLESWGRNPSTQKQAVPVVRIDDCVAAPGEGERLLVLMDVEGYEYFALRGAERLIRSEPKPVWMIEVVSGPAGTDAATRAKGTFDFLLSAGYSAVTADVTLSEATAPREDASNFLFFDAELSVEEVLGHENSRVKPLI